MQAFSHNPRQTLPNKWLPEEARLKSKIPLLGFSIFKTNLGFRRSGSPDLPIV
jgi:hypothetical protein